MRLNFRPTLLALATLALPGLALAEGVRVSVDWPGAYVGTVPCASCAGIDMVLSLTEDGLYALSETYQGEKTAPFEQTGKVAWDAGGNVITLLADEDRRSFFVSEDHVVMLGEGGQPDEDYVLDRLADASAHAEPAPATAPVAVGAAQTFVGGGANLTVSPQSIVRAAMESNGDRHVVFDALMNFEHRAEGGHKSLQATFDINCTKNEYDMPAVTYYAEHDAGGQVLDSTTDNADNWLPIDTSANDDVITQAARALCD